MRVDLHNHTPLCNHAKGEPREYIKRAIEVGIDVFGFSDHAPMDFDKAYRMDITEVSKYRDIVKNLQNEFSSEIEIRYGFEVDFLDNDSFLEDIVFKEKVDYLIGSVHFINKWGFDNPEFIGEYKNKDIDKIWEDYFLMIELMAKKNIFDIVGHLDLIKVFKFLPKKDIRILAKNAIKEIRKSNMVVEINSAGFKKPIKEQYPSKELLELVFENNIDITFGSDAHSIDRVGDDFNKCLDVAKEIGFSKVVDFKQRDKIFYNL